MSKDDLLRVRCEQELKDKLRAIADRKKTDLSEFVRQKLWGIVHESERSQATADPIREIFSETGRRRSKGASKLKRKEA